MLIDGHRAFSPVASLRREFPDAATCRPSRIGTSARVLRPKPPNRAASSVPCTRPPPTRVLPPQTSTAVALSTRSLHVSSRSSMSQVSATTACHPAIWSLSPSLTSALHHSRSIGTARPPWPSPRRRLPDPQLGTCTTRTKKHVARHTAVCQ